MRLESGLTQFDIFPFHQRAHMEMNIAFETIHSRMFSVVICGGTRQSNGSTMIFPIHFQSVHMSDFDIFAGRTTWRIRSVRVRFMPDFSRHYSSYCFLSSASSTLTNQSNSEDLLFSVSDIHSTMFSLSFAVEHTSPMARR